MKGLRILVSLSLFFTLLLSCSQDSVRDELFFKRGSLRAAENYLTAIIEVNTPGFFLKKGVPTGYHYNLLVAYTKSRGLVLKVIPFISIEQAKAALKSGKADVLAMESNSIVGEDFRKTIPHWRLQYSTISLSGKPVGSDDLLYVPSNLFSKQDVAALRSSHKNMVSYDELNTGVLAEHLLSNPLAYAVVHTSIAQAINLKYGQLNVNKFSEAPLGSWYVSPKSSILNDLNTWIAETRGTGNHPRFYSSFYQNYIVNKSLSTSIKLTGEFTLSEYDPLVKAYSLRIGWDWLLVSALIYQESQFKPEVVSPKGARGLMQVMPQTANLFGFDSNHSPKENLWIGTKLLERLTRAFSKYPIADDERYKFVLASYNGGIGHILDAMRLAAKYGRDPYSWDNVAMFLRLKKNPAYFNDRVVRFGIFNDYETTKFVEDVTARYQSYKALSLSL